MTKHPEPNYICDITGFKHPRSEMVEMWNGLYVHKTQWEKRQPQDFVSPVRVPNPILDARPYTEPTYTSYTPASLFITEDGDPFIIEGEQQYFVTE
jgi:hypothetical protein